MQDWMQFFFQGWWRGRHNQARNQVLRVVGGWQNTFLGGKIVVFIYV